MIDEWRMMHEYEEVRRMLAVWNGRRRLRDGLIWVPRALLAGLLAAVVLATVARFRPLLTNQEVGLAALGLGLTGLLAGALAVALRRVDVPAQARFADRQFGLRERATTAVELHAGQIETTPTLARLQAQDTLASMRAVDVDRALPLRLVGRDWLLLLLAAFLLATAVLLDNPQVPSLLSQRAVAAGIAQQAAELEALAETIAANPDLSDAQREALLEPVADALEALQSADLSQAEAVATLSEAEAQLRALGNAFDNPALRQTLPDAGAALAQGQAGQEMGGALQEGALNQAGAAAAQLADDLAALSAGERQALAADLQAAADALQTADAELAAELREAAAALQNDDLAAAQDALREAAGTLQQRAQETAVAQQAQQAADQLGQGRQAVAQAGQPGSQSGQQAGDQPAPGQGAGGGDQPGAGGEPGSGGASAADGGGGPGGPGPGGGHTENVFVPDFSDLSGVEGVDVELPAECLGNPEACGELRSETPRPFDSPGSVVPYTQVFGDYRNAANQALAGDYIPLGLKGFVRDYFASLEP